MKKRFLFSYPYSFGTSFIHLRQISKVTGPIATKIFEFYSQLDGPQEVATILRSGNSRDRGARQGGRLCDTHVHVYRHCTILIGRFQAKLLKSGRKLSCVKDLGPKDFLKKRADGRIIGPPESRMSSLGPQDANCTRRFAEGPRGSGGRKQDR